MGTHPIFESDFDCLTEMAEEKEVFGTDYPALRKHIAAYGRHSLSQDPRFINTNRQRQCWINYSEFYRCLYVREYLGKDTEVCGYFRNNFLQACPPQQIATYDEQAKITFSPQMSTAEMSPTVKSGSQSTKHGRSKPKPPRPVKPNIANFSNPKSRYPQLTISV